MVHKKVYGIGENKCKVEVIPKKTIDSNAAKASECLRIQFLMKANTSYTIPYSTIYDMLANKKLVNEVITITQVLENVQTSIAGIGANIFRPLNENSVKVGTSYSNKKIVCTNQLSSNITVMIVLLVGDQHIISPSAV